MTHSQLTLTALLDGIYPLEVRRSSLTLDESWAPYARLSLTCAMPSAIVLAQLDPRSTTPRRITGLLRQDFGVAGALADRTTRFAGQPLSARTAVWPGRGLRARTASSYTPWNSFGVRPARLLPFDLTLDARDVDHAAGTVQIEAVSDEATLQGDALLASSSYTFLSRDVRTIVGFVLARIGASLEVGTATGTVDADVVWEPGVVGWTLLEPLLQKTGLRLRCTERRVWQLVPADTIVPGQVNLTYSGTITALRDSISRRSDEWCDAVVVRYRWTDTAGAQQTAIDTAGATPASNVRTVTIEGRYPGPGAAARILKAAQGRGRKLDPQAVADPAVVPGMAAVVSFPTADPQTGYVRAVRFDLPEDRMTVTTRGLIDTPATAYRFGSETTKYNTVPASITYNNFTWEATA